MKKAFTLLLIVLVSEFCSAQTWTKKTDYLGTARNRARAFSIPSLGKGYVIGGWDGTYQKHTYEYDTLSDAWTQKTDFPGASTVSVAFSIGGYGYAGTGVTFSTHDSTFWEFDPVGNTWTKKANFPGGELAYAVGFSIGGKGYMGGGCVFYQGYNAFFEYDPVANKWDSIAPCPAIGCHCGAVGFSIGNKGYVGTGNYTNPSGNQFIQQSDFYEYDPATDVWTKKADVPGGARGEGMGFATCNMGYIGGGYKQTHASFADDWWEYNPVKDKWTQVANFGGGLQAYGCGFAIGKSGYVGLGYTTQNLNNWYEYHALPVTAFTTVGASTTTICQGQSITFIDTSSFEPNGWLWTFPGGTPGTSNLQSPVIKYDTAGTYNVSLIAWTDCDTASQTLTAYVTVTPAAPLTATANPPVICGGQTTTLTVTGGSTYTWSPALGLNLTTGANVIADPAVTTTYTVNDSSGSCTAIGTVVVQVANNTVAGTVSAINDTLCVGTPGTLMLTGNSTDSIQWQESTTPNNFVDVVGADSTTYQTFPLNQTTYYRVVVGKGMCTDTTSPPFSIYVPPALTAVFTTNTSGNVVTFNSGGSQGDITYYYWDFGDNSPFSNDSNPVHTYPPGVVDTYTVCLTIYDGSNCSYTYCSDVGILSGISNINADNNFKVFPSPFGNQLIIEDKKRSGIQRVELMDMLGRTILSQPATHNTQLITLQTSALAKGVYFLKIKTAIGDYVKKVVRE